MKTVVIFDVDGVLLNLRPHLVQSFAEFTNTNVDTANINSVLQFVKENPEKHDEYIEFMSHHQGYSELEALDGMKELIDYLVEKGCILHIVSAALNDKISLEFRLKNIKDKFGDVFETIHCLAGKCKKETLSKLCSSGDLSFFIDDDPEKVHDSINIVFQPLWLENDGFLDKRHFLEHSRIIKVENAKKIRSTIMAHIGELSRF